MSDRLVGVSPPPRASPLAAPHPRLAARIFFLGPSGMPSFSRSLSVMDRRATASISSLAKTPTYFPKPRAENIAHRLGALSSGDGAVGSGVDARVSTPSERVAEIASRRGPANDAHDATTAVPRDRRTTVDARAKVVGLGAGELVVLPLARGPRLDLAHAPAGDPGKHRRLPAIPRAFAKGAHLADGGRADGEGAHAALTRLFLATPTADIHLELRHGGRRAS